MQALALDLRALGRGVDMARLDEGVETSLWRTVGVDDGGAWRLEALAKRAVACRLLVEGVGAKWALTP